MGPPETDGRKAIEQTIRRLQIYWLALLCLPLVYLGACIAIQEWWFGPSGRHGILPWAHASNAPRVLLGIFGLVAVLSEGLLFYLQRRFGQWLAAADENPAEFIRLLCRRLFVLGAICDTVSFLGLVYFLLAGYLPAMLAFGVLSYVLYAQIYPHERLVGRLKVHN